MVILTLNWRRRKHRQAQKMPARPRRWKILTFSALALLVAAVSYLLLPYGDVVVENNIDAEKVMQMTEAVTAAPGTAQPIYRANISDKKVALTFDISWGEKMPPKVMDILRQKELCCTFFISGPWTKKHPETVRQLVSDGHEIASHGHSHVNFSSLSRAGVAANIKNAHDAIKEVAGVEAKYIRPPNGDFNSVSLEVTKENGYETIIWSLDSLDWKNLGVQAIIERLLTRVKPGDIILMHASDTCQQTDSALPQVIEGISAQGFEFVTVSELLRLQEAKAE